MPAGERRLGRPAQPCVHSGSALADDLAWEQTRARRPMGPWQPALDQRPPAADPALNKYRQADGAAAPASSTPEDDFAPPLPETIYGRNHHPEPSPNRRSSSSRRRNGKGASPRDSLIPRCSQRRGSKPNSRPHKGPNPLRRRPEPIHFLRPRLDTNFRQHPGHSSFRSADSLSHRAPASAATPPGLLPDPGPDSSYPRSHH
jgi:hypothetical protein